MKMFQKDMRDQLHKRDISNNFVQAERGDEKIEEFSISELND
jgi:hypothetical protein